jgi:hypothetical protein
MKEWSAAILLVKFVGHFDQHNTASIIRMYGLDWIHWSHLMRVTSSIDISIIMEKRIRFKVLLHWHFSLMRLQLYLPL